MYKRWIISQNSATNSRTNWLKYFFESLENILEELKIEFTSRYTWVIGGNSVSGDCDCSSNNLSVMKEKGYPEWIADFMYFPEIAGSISSGWTNNNKCYISGFLSFSMNNIKYCIVYDTQSENTWWYHHATLLIDFGNDKKYKNTIDFWYAASASEAPTNTGMGRWGTNNHVLVEYHRTDYMEFLNLSFNGLTTTAADYYTVGKFVSFGYYKINDGMKLYFPGGFALSDTDPDSTLFDQLCFITDSEGLIKLINGNLGDQITNNYIKGNVYYGVKNNRIIGKLENAITINNYNFDPGTVFTYGGIKYGKIRIPVVDNIICADTDYSKYGAALSLAFHKGVYD